MDSGSKDRQRDPLKAGDEYDVVTSWRRYYCMYKKAGKASEVKRRIRRRERATAKLQLRKELLA
jgi:hypothetical protein